MMACPGPRLAAEKAFLAALAGTHRATIAGDRLTLAPASGAALAFQAEPPPTLEGVVEQERRFLAALGTARVWTVENGTVSSRSSR